MNWEVLSFTRCGRYVYARVPKHPNATSTGYVLYHRILVENSIGRLLTADEVVHHIDLNPLNNDLSNLQLLTATEHVKLHARLREHFIELVCPQCGKTFRRKYNNRPVIKNNKQGFCSRRCNGLYHGFKTRV